MNETPSDELASRRWALALRAAQVFAVDPAGCGGILVKGGHSPVRTRWLDALGALLANDSNPPPIRRVPIGVDAARLLGGLDLAATLAQGQGVCERGLLEQVDGGVLILPSAERIEASSASIIASAMDSGEVAIERDGLTRRAASRFGLIALDEADDDEDGVCATLQDRIAMAIDLNGIALAVTREEVGEVRAVATRITLARKVLAGGPGLGDDDIAAALELAQRLGIESTRRAWWMLRVARVLGAIEGLHQPAPTAHGIAAGLSLLPWARHAMTVPAPLPDASSPDASSPDASPPETPERAAESGDQVPTAPAPSDAPASALQSADTGSTRRSDPQPEPPDSTPANRTLTDTPLQWLDAAAANLPENLLGGPGRLSRAPRHSTAKPGGRAHGRAAASLQIEGGRRGRRAGTLRARSSSVGPLNLLETLRAAAPWQAMRRASNPDSPCRIQVRREDFRIDRRIATPATTIVFVVDASGSSALHRLGEAKGAVERLLAECYVRRDRVALLAFRDRRADLLLPPTRSLVRARRSLAGVPGGGATPLAAGIDAAAALAAGIRRQGHRPVLVFMTDGQGNIDRDGRPGRADAARDAFAAARRVAQDLIDSILIDTSPRPQDSARRLAMAMGANYQPLPLANAGSLSSLVRRAMQAP